MAIVSPNFQGRGQGKDELPPGQYLVRDWPVLTYGPTPNVSSEEWQLRVSGLINKELTIGWDQLQKLPSDTWKTDIHCVTRWSKLGTTWRGVWLDDIIMAAGGVKPEAKYLIEASYGGYTTDVPLAEATDHKAMVAFEFEGDPLPKEHGGPVRFLIPGFYFWKSAKWLHELHFLDHDELGFWEVNGYHAHGNPWKEERYSGD